METAEPKKIVDAAIENGKRLMAESADAELVRTNYATRERRAAPERNGTEDLMGEGEGQLTIDVYQTPAEIVVESPIAGVNPDDLDISITNEGVTIRGKRERIERVREEDYFYQECYWGRFSRSVVLPQEVDAENAEATIKNGVLVIRLPKINRQKSKKLKVRFS